MNFFEEGEPFHIRVKLSLSDEGVEIDHAHELYFERVEHLGGDSSDFGVVGVLVVEVVQTFG